MYGLAIDVTRLDWFKVKSYIESVCFENTFVWGVRAQAIVSRPSNSGMF